MTHLKDTPWERVARNHSSEDLESGDVFIPTEVIQRSTTNPR